MEKLELLSRIQTLSSLLHHSDLAKLNLSEASVKEMHRVLDEMSEKYIELYCEAS